MQVSFKGRSLGSKIFETIKFCTNLFLVVDYNDTKCIFAIGGLDDNMCYNNVERYDPSADTWKQVANLKIHRGGVCAVTLNGEVYAIGGNDGVQSKV